MKPHTDEYRKWLSGLKPGDTVRVVLEGRVDIVHQDSLWASVGGQDVCIHTRQSAFGEKEGRGRLKRHGAVIILPWEEGE